MSRQLAASDLDKFLSLLERSGLLTAEQFAEVRDKSDGHDDAQALARYLVKQKRLTRWQAAQLLSGWNGFLVGKYRLLNQIGAGEHGRVFLAEHATMGRRALLRTLPRRAAERPELMQRFFDETQAAAQLDHRNLVHVYDVNSDGDRYYIVMEHVEGRDLATLVAEDGPLSAIQAADCIHQAAEGLAHGHAQHVVHGELTPSKVLIDSQQAVKVLEMGLSGLDDPNDLLDDPEAEGASAYLAPEQRESNSPADARSDIYSLGAILYYLLAGKSPQAPAAAPKPRDVLQLRGDVPESLIVLCEKMMASRPADRFASARDVANALGAWLTEHRPSQPPPVRTEHRPMTLEPVQTRPAPREDESKGRHFREREDRLKARSPRDDTQSKRMKAVNLAEDETIAPLLDDDFPLASLPAPKLTPMVKPASESLPLPLVIGGAAGGGAVLVGIVALVLWMAFGGDSGNSDIAVRPPDPPSVSPPPLVPVSPQPPQPETKTTALVDTSPPTPLNNDKKAPRETIAATNVTPQPPTPNPGPPPRAVSTGGPFDGMLGTVDLPTPLDAAGKPNHLAGYPLALGPVNARLGTLLSARLIGGDTAARGVSFKLQNVGEASQHRWEISATETRSPQPVAIAQLGLKDGQLLFVWKPIAQSSAAAAGLVNCVLDLSIGATKHQVALRKPVHVPAIRLALDKPMKIDVPLTNTPDPSAVKVELFPLGGTGMAFDKNVLAADKGKSLVAFSTNPAEQALLAEVSTVLRRDLTFNIAPMFSVAADKPQIFSTSAVSRSLAAVNLRQQELAPRIERLRKSDKKDDDIVKGLARFEAEMKTLTESNHKLEKLGDQYTAVHNKARLGFRIYYVPADGIEIDLAIAQIEPPAEEKPKE